MGGIWGEQGGRRRVKYQQPPIIIIAPSIANRKDLTELIDGCGGQNLGEDTVGRQPLTTPTLPPSPFRQKPLPRKANTNQENKITGGV